MYTICIFNVNFFERKYTILHTQQTQIKKNFQNYVYSIYTFFNECTHFLKYNETNF